MCTAWPAIPGPIICSAFWPLWWGPVRIKTQTRVLTNLPDPFFLFWSFVTNSQCPSRRWPRGHAPVPSSMASPAPGSEGNPPPPRALTKDEVVTTKWLADLDRLATNLSRIITQLWTKTLPEFTCDPSYAIASWLDLALLQEAEHVDPRKWGRCLRNIRWAEGNNSATGMGVC